MIFHQAAYFILRHLLKKFSLPILLIFWAYTWHAYAVSAVGQKDPVQKTQKTVFKEQSSGTQLLSSIQNEIKFMKRPFISKGDTIIMEPFHLHQPTSSGERCILLKSFAFQNSSDITYLLRAPPALI